MKKDMPWKYTIFARQPGTMAPITVSVETFDPKETIEAACAAWDALKNVGFIMSSQRPGFI